MDILSFEMRVDYPATVYNIWFHTETGCVLLVQSSPEHSCLLNGFCKVSAGTEGNQEQHWCGLCFAHVVNICGFAVLSLFILPHFVVFPCSCSESFFFFCYLCLWFVWVHFSTTENVDTQTHIHAERDTSNPRCIWRGPGIDWGQTYEHNKVDKCPWAEQNPH